jgi:hypothetical protein
VTQEKVKRGLGKTGNLFQSTPTKATQISPEANNSIAKNSNQVTTGLKPLNVIENTSGKPSFNQESEAKSRIIPKAETGLFGKNTGMNSIIKANTFYSPSLDRSNKPPVSFTAPDYDSKTSIINDAEEARVRKAFELSPIAQEITSRQTDFIGKVMPSFNPMISSNSFFKSLNTAVRDAEIKNEVLPATNRLSFEFEEENVVVEKTAQVESVHKLNLKKSTETEIPKELTLNVIKTSKTEPNIADLEIMSKMFDRLTDKCKNLSPADKAACQQDQEKITEFFAKICYEIDDHFVKRCEELLSVFLNAQSNQAKFMFLLRELCLKIFSDLRTRIKSSKIVIVSL